MASVSLFQKYRSQRFEDLIGQEVVVRTLKNGLASGRMANVYLFCGPRGTGKTSTARILAKALNCEGTADNPHSGPTAEPCCQCSACRSIAEGSCLDVLEIDAASNTQVDKIREFIVDKVQFAPAQVRYKVYIIDEVHKLSDSSFNALLKTLEEPPKHVVFILATTDPEKIPATIISRCQRYNFQRFTLQQTVNHIKSIAAKENVQIDDLAAELIARSSEGSMRDALVTLEQAMFFCCQQGGSQQISGEDVRGLLGLAGAEAIQDLVSGFIAQDTGRVLGLLDELINKGRNLNKLAAELLEYLRQMMLVCVKAADQEVLGVTDNYFQELVKRSQLVKLGTILSWIGSISELQRRLSGSQNARLSWETVLVQLTAPLAGTDQSSLLARIETLEAEVSALKIIKNSYSAQSPIVSTKPIDSLMMPKASDIEAHASNLEHPSVSVVDSASVVGATSATKLKVGKVVKNTQSLAPNALTTSSEMASSTGQIDDLGWGTTTTKASSSLSSTKVAQTEPESATVAKASASYAKNESKNKQGSAGKFWQKLLAYLEDKKPSIFALVRGTKCLSARQGVIVIKFESDRQDDYEAASKERANIESVLTEAMQRPIQIDLRLGKVVTINPQDEYMHTVNLVLNSFAGQTLSKYANDSASDPTARVEA